MKKRAVGYCRISTLMQVDNTSLKDQENKIIMYAKLHDIVIDELFIDKAVSGKSTDRPEYDNMMNYINAAHEATAQTEARICVDAVQRYLNDEKEKGKLTGGMLLRLMGLDLSNSDGPLKDYISGGQKGARIVSVEADLATGRLQVLKYENRYCTVKLNIDEDGNITEASD